MHFCFRSYVNFCPDNCTSLLAGRGLVSLECALACAERARRASSCNSSSQMRAVDFDVRVATKTGAVAAVSVNLRLCTFPMDTQLGILPRWDKT